ncbi:hypothetical protein CVN68_09875 [Sphingomonas psychrotolerans]|uniref:Uncharacterized protein n=1 Tax=Sphingomonas psychrotolerans TaxID=1327635 RepID=A0A2K8MI79_9SPHN|nr:hypothetical protein CVN68_09875 [Sphingomonas psychrotolerans]
MATDQCYKMQEPRRYRGIWINDFEGQEFIPEGTTAAEWPGGDAKSPGWREGFERVRAAKIWLDVSRVKPGRGSEYDGREMLIEFIGRKTLYPGHHGHLGMSGHEIIVDRVILLKKCPKKGVCG